MALIMKTRLVIIMIDKTIKNHSMYFLWNKAIWIQELIHLLWKKNRVRDQGNYHTKFLTPKRKPDQKTSK